MQHPLVFPYNHINRARSTFGRLFCNAQFAMLAPTSENQIADRATESNDPSDRTLHSILLHKNTPQYKNGLAAVFFPRCAFRFLKRTWCRPSAP